MALISQGLVYHNYKELPDHSNLYPSKGVLNRVQRVLIWSLILWVHLTTWLQWLHVESFQKSPTSFWLSESPSCVSKRSCFNSVQNPLYKENHIQSSTIEVCLQSLNNNIKWFPDFLKE